MVVQVATVDASSSSGSCYNVSVVGLSTGVVLIAKWWEDVVWMHIYLHQGVAGGKYSASGVESGELGFCQKSYVEMP